MNGSRVQVRIEIIISNLSIRLTTLKSRLVSIRTRMMNSFTKCCLFCSFFRDRVNRSTMLHTREYVSRIIVCCSLMHSSLKFIINNIKSLTENRKLSLLSPNRNILTEFLYEILVITCKTVFNSLTENVDKISYNFNLYHVSCFNKLSCQYCEIIITA